MALPANFYIPSTAIRKPIFRCRICETEFFEGEENKIDRHMKDCSDRNENELRENTLRVKNPWLFDPECEDTDVEFREYVQRTGNWH